MSKVPAVLEWRERDLGSVGMERDLGSVRMGSASGTNSALGFLDATLLFWL